MKFFLLSKTVWFNIATTLAAVTVYMASQPAFETWIPWLTIASGIINIVLRIWFTDNKPLGFSTKK